MSPNLRHFLTEHYGQLPEGPGQMLLLYVAFVQCFCYQYQIPYDPRKPLEGLLPQLFHQVPGYEIKDAAITFDAAMPWGLLQGNPTLSDALDRLRQRLDRASCATPLWLREQVDDLLGLGHAFSDVVVTPPSIRALIAQLAVQQPIQQIIDLCSGTFSLGLQVWNEAGADPLISCQGEEINADLCAFSRLLLFLCGVKNFSVKERNVMAPPQEQPNQKPPPSIYVADLPLVGNRTLPSSKHDPLFQTQKMNLYSDWLFIRSVLNRMHAGDRAFLIVTKGALVRQKERALREDLVKHDWLEAVIKLPAGLYPNHNLPLELFICEKGRTAEKQGRVFFADLSSYSVPATRRTKRLSQDGISKLCHAFQHFTDEENFSKAVSVPDIQSAGYALYPPPYLAAPQASANPIRLGDVAAVIRGLQLTKEHPSYQHAPRYFLNIRDLQDGEIRYENAEQIEIGSPLWERKYRIQEDDIILTSKGSTLKLAIVPPNPPPSYISGNLTLLRIKADRYSPYVLYEYLTSEAGQLALSLIQTGTTIRVLGIRNLEQLNLPSYDRSLAAKIGSKLKLAALEYRQNLSNIHETYANQKMDLLFQLTQRKEIEK